MSGNSQKEAAAHVWTRRGFVGALGLLIASRSNAMKGIKPAADSDWRNDFPGRSVLHAEPDYEAWRQAMPWQMHTVERFPDMIVRPNTAAAIPGIITRARHQGQRVAIKSGGHNVSEAFLRNGGTLLDLGELQAVNVDPETSTVWVEPALWSHGLVRALEPHNLAFPVAHCATVPMGGYLLGGGLGYNHDNWGTLACDSILAAEVVLASGEKVIASPDSHPELYWAVRGAGTGFFGVVTRYKLQLYKNPGTTQESSYIFPLSMLDEATSMLQDWAASSPLDTELMMLLAHNPMATAETDPLDSKMCIVRAVTYAATAKDAGRELKKLGNHPSTEKALMKNERVSTSLSQMQVESVNANMGLGFGHYAVDTVWTNRLPDVMRAIKQHFVNANSAKTHFVVSPKMNRKLDGGAFSVIGDTFVGAYAMWDEASDTPASFNWLDGTSRLMRPLAVGQYINEVDAFRDTTAPKRCFSPETWKQLAQLRKHYDPTGQFFSWP